MAHPATPLLVCALLALLSTPADGVRARRQGGGRESPRYEQLDRANAHGHANDEAMDEIKSLLVTEKKDLQCSVCKQTLKEVQQVLQPLRRGGTRTPKAYEVYDALDGLCIEFRNAYGLLRKNDRPSTTISRNTKISRAMGESVTPFIEDACADVLDEAEDSILAGYHKPLATFQREICQDELVLCSDAKLSSTDEEL